MTSPKPPLTPPAKRPQARSAGWVPPTSLFPAAASKPQGGHEALGAQVAAARATWSRLSEQDVLNTEFHAADLASLVERRYGIRRSEAESQVRQFLAWCKA